MSYMRPLCPYEYLEGESEGDYVFDSGKIEDYGSMKTETALDILFKQSSFIEDNKILIHCLKRICENLDIKMRETPLTMDEFFELHGEIHKRVGKEHDAVHAKADRGSK